MSFLSRFPGTTLEQDRSDARESVQDRMEAAHTRIKAVLEQLHDAAWGDIVMPDAASESDVSFAEERARLMERNVVLQLGWLAGAR